MILHRQLVNMEIGTERHLEFYQTTCVQKSVALTSKKILGACQTAVRPSQLGEPKLRTIIYSLIPRTEGSRPLITL